MKEAMEIDTDANCQQERPDIAQVELRLSGDRLVPAEVTAASGLLPSRAWRKGDTYESKAGGIRTRSFGIWVITSEGTDVEQCSVGLLAKVEPLADAIRHVARTAGATVSVGIWWEPEGGQGGFTVSSDVMRRLSELGDRVDVYFPG